MCHDINCYFVFVKSSDKRLHWRNRLFCSHFFKTPRFYDYSPFYSHVCTCLILFYLCTTHLNLNKRDFWMTCITCFKCGLKTFNEPATSHLNLGFPRLIVKFSFHGKDSFVFASSQCDYLFTLIHFLVHIYLLAFPGDLCDSDQMWS